MDPAVKHKALRLISNGMFVLTSRSGERVGAATVTWLSQASFKPPLLMAAVRPDSSVFKCMKQSGMAAVHILGADQQEIAKTFFATSEYNAGLINGEPCIAGKTRSPILQSARAFVECNVTHIYDDGGDHTLVVLEVIDAVVRDDVLPLTIGDSPWEYGG